jgi:hypothetical protein
MYTVFITTDSSANEDVDGIPERATYVSKGNNVLIREAGQ